MADWNINEQLRARAGTNINRDDEDLGQVIADALRFERTTHIPPEAPKRKPKKEESNE
jgi:hypothetical protein